MPKPAGKPKVRRRSAAGLLGVDSYRSSEDEDYVPSPRTTATTGGGKRQRCRPSQRQPHDEDVPLAKLRRALRRVKHAADAGLPAAQAGAGAAPAAVHLPQDVLSKVLQAACACSGGGVPTAATAACVSRAWRDAVRATPDLWSRVDLAYGWCRPSDAAIAAALPRWAQLRSLSLSGCATLSDVALAAIAARCPLLQRLDISHASCFTGPGLSAALPAMLLRAPGPGSSPLRALDLSFLQLTPRTSALDAVLREVLAAQAQNPGGPALEVRARRRWGRPGSPPSPGREPGDGGSPPSAPPRCRTAASAALCFHAPGCPLPLPPAAAQELVVEGCPLITHQALRAATEAAAAAGRPLLGALRVLDLSQSAGARTTMQDLCARLQRPQRPSPSCGPCSQPPLCAPPFRRPQ